MKLGENNDADIIVNYLKPTRNRHVFHVLSFFQTSSVNLEHFVPFMVIELMKKHS